MLLVMQLAATSAATSKPFTYGFLRWTARSAANPDKVAYIYSSVFAYCTAEVGYEGSITADARTTFNEQLKKLPGYALEGSPWLSKSETRELAALERKRDYAIRAKNGFETTSATYTYEYKMYGLTCTGVKKLP
jgi:hypothetical protein